MQPITYGLTPTLPVTNTLCRRWGKFLLEIDGDKDDPQKSIQCLEEILKVTDDIFPESVEPEIRFSGNKSFYLQAEIDNEPCFNLHLKHKKLAMEMVGRIPEQYRPMIDMGVYDYDQTLRLEGSEYPDGIGFNVSVDRANLDWDAISLSSGNQEMGGLQMETVYTNGRQPVNFPLYEDLTSQVGDMPAEIKSSANRAKQAKILAEKTRQHIDQGIIAPCVEIIRDRIREGESIGFDGRNKFISESLKIGFDLDWIVDSFLQFPDPYRYGVLERDVETESGYRINEQYSPELLSELDVSCLKCAEFCQVDSCYRSSEFLPDSESPSFDQFRWEGREKLAQAIDKNI